MKPFFSRNLIIILTGLLFTMQVQAEELLCFAKIKPDLQMNEFTSEKQSQDFAVTETKITQYGDNYSVRKYRVEIENFVVEGTLFLNSGLVAELSVTDLISGAVAQVKEHNMVRLYMSSPRAGGFTHLFAGCTLQ